MNDRVNDHVNDPQTDKVALAQLCNACRQLVVITRTHTRTRPDRSRHDRCVIQEYFSCPHCCHENVIGVELQ